MEEARIASELDSQEFSDVSVIQDASLKLKKSGPPRLMLLMVGTLLGISLGLLQALLRDAPNAGGQEPATQKSSHASRNGAGETEAPRANEDELVEAGGSRSSLPR